MQTLVQAYMDSWRPSPGWSEVVRPAYEVLRDPEAALGDALDAWSRLAMMLGDTRAAPLCVWVCLHAQSRLPAGMRHEGAAAHLGLSLWDLGLAAPVEVADEAGGTRHVMTCDHDALQGWLDENLAPFRDLGGDEEPLARAAVFSLRLAALRTGVITGPSSPTLLQMLDVMPWRQPSR